MHDPVNDDKHLGRVAKITRFERIFRRVKFHDSNEGIGYFSNFFFFFHTYK